MFLTKEQIMVTITNSTNWSGSGLLKSFSEKLGRWLFELRNWEQSQKLKHKEIFVFHFWCFLSVFALTKIKFSVEKPWLVCWACVYSIFICPIYKTSNKQYMTPTLRADVSPAFYSKNKFSWKHCQILWSTLKLTESCKYILREKKGKLKVSSF